MRSAQQRRREGAGRILTSPGQRSGVHAADQRRRGWEVARVTAVKGLEVSLYVLLREPKDAIDHRVDDLGPCRPRIIGVIQGLPKAFPAQAMRDPGQCPGRIRTKRLRTIERRRQQREDRSAVTAAGPVRACRCERIQSLCSRATISGAALAPRAVTRLSQAYSAKPPATGARSRTASKSAACSMRRILGASRCNRDGCTAIVVACNCSWALKSK